MSELIHRTGMKVDGDHDGMQVIVMESDLIKIEDTVSRLRELLGEALDRIPHWQRCAIFDNPEEQCDCERSDIQSRIQSELKE